mmetsp:Transcript_80034/g.183350  ORF Transcript_80034/g.183350 Transcript_80034/m.183350 type:complete len:624 (-) Transcript_80034:191-2062(-)
MVASSGPTHADDAMAETLKEQLVEVKPLDMPFSHGLAPRGRNNDYWISKAAGAEGDGRFDDAARHLQRAVDLDGKSLLAWVRLAYMHMQLDRFSQALHALRRALDLKDKFPRDPTERDELHFRLLFNTALLLYKHSREAAVGPDGEERGTQEVKSALKNLRQAEELKVGVEHQRLVLVLRALCYFRANEMSRASECLCAHVDLQEIKAQQEAATARAVAGVTRAKKVAAQWKKSVSKGLREAEQSREESGETALPSDQSRVDRVDVALPARAAIADELARPPHLRQVAAAVSTVHSWPLFTRFSASAVAELLLAGTLREFGVAETVWREPGSMKVVMVLLTGSILLQLEDMGLDGSPSVPTVHRTFFPTEVCSEESIAPARRIPGHRPVVVAREPARVLVIPASAVMEISGGAAGADRASDKRMGLLSGLPLFAGAPVQPLQNLAAKLQQVASVYGEVVLHAGQVVEGLWIVTEGLVTVLLPCENGRDLTFATIRPGGYFGLSSLRTVEDKRDGRPAAGVSKSKLRVRVDSSTAAFFLARKKDVQASSELMAHLLELDAEDYPDPVAPCEHEIDGLLQTHNSWSRYRLKERDSVLSARDRARTPRGLPRRRPLVSPAARPCSR